MTMPPDRPTASAITFWYIAAGLVVFKLALISDLSVIVNYSPHDDTLYVEHAFQLLAGHGFGPYDSRTFVKYPGLSLWLAGARTLGLPYLLTITAVFVAAGIYLSAAMLRNGCNRLVVLIAFAAFLFNPITYGAEWYRVLREPLGTGLLIAMAAAMMYLFAGASQCRPGWRHAFVLGLCFAFSLYLREDDKLLWLLLAMFGIAFGALCLRAHATRILALRSAALVMMVPAVFGIAYERVLHEFSERYYGMPIIHELSEGEFPRMLAAIRSIDSAKDNRMVMVTQETLERLREEIPRFAPVVARLPPPGPGTLSCRLQGVCSEWSNGWMPFWIRDAAWRAGLTPDLPAAQAYYREIRVDIERACDSGRLKCTRRGDSLVPPMELRWIHAYVREAWRLAGMAFSPEPDVLAESQVRFDVPLEIGRMYQAVTMTADFDTQAQANLSIQPPGQLLTNPLAPLRLRIAGPWRAVIGLLLFAALAVLVGRLWRLASPEPEFPDPFALAVMVFGLFFLLRFAALSYVAVFMGGFDPRMMFSTYTVAAFLSLPFVYHSLFPRSQNV